MTALPDTKRFNWGLKQLATGDTEFVSFGPWKNTDWELGPNDNFRVAVCKRVLDFGEDPQPIAFFQKEFRELHDILGEVIERHFGQVRFDEELQNEEGWAVLNRFLLRPVKLGSLIEAVYDNDGNLMTVACDPKRRMEVVQGVIVRILRARVWDSLLFGGTPKQLENVIHEERRLATDNRIEGKRPRQPYIAPELTMRRICKTEEAKHTHQGGASPLPHREWSSPELPERRRVRDPGDLQSDLAIGKPTASQRTRN